MTSQLRYTDTHVGLDVAIQSCHCMAGISIWERVWGSAEFFIQIVCEEAEGPDEFFTKSYKRNKKIAIEEKFTFVLPVRFVPKENEDQTPLKIHITLYKNGQKFGSADADITKAGLLQKQNLDIEFSRSQEILKLDIELEKRQVIQPDFRYSFNCSDEEVAATTKRKHRVFESMKTFLPNSKLDSVEEVPSIAVVCSGGGYRATTQFCGAMEAVRDSGLLDCITYLAGLSGGSWYILPAYVKKVFKDADTLLDYHSEIKYAARSSLILNSLADISHYLRYRKYARAREAEGQPTTFVDFYGYSVARTFLGYSMINTKLSDISEYAESGDVPIPVITSLHTKSKVSSVAFSSDLEVTPWEASLPHYGINVPVTKFGSEWYKGSIVRSCPEYPLHYFLGASSIAFGILLKYYLKGETTEADKNFVKDIRQHEFGRHKTKRQTRDIRRRVATTTRRKQFAKYAEEAKTDNHVDLVFKRQKSRSSTKRIRKLSERQYHAASETIPEAAIMESPTKSINGDAGQQGNFLAVPEDQWKVESNQSERQSGRVLQRGNFLAVSAPEKSEINTNLDDANFVETFKRRTCRFSSATSEYDTADEGDPDEDLFFAANSRSFHSRRQGDDGLHRDKSEMNANSSTKKAKEKNGSPCLKRILKRVSNHPLFTDREAVIDRTAKAFNMARGFSSVQYHHLNPNHIPTREEHESQNISTVDDIVTFVDPAVICNVPCNALLRRKADVIIVCDATEYKSDTDIDYLELFLTESIAKKQGLKFPKIDPQKLKDDPRGIVHVFEEKGDPECPIIIWFTLCNKEFKMLKDVPLPPRRKIDDNYKLPPSESFNVFPVYGPQSPYQTLNTRYTPLQFDRMRALMKHSVSSKMEIIKHQISKKIYQRKALNRCAV